MQQFAGAEIGARIAQARREADGMTQEQLAELLNVSTRSVQDYEAGVTMPWRHFKLLETAFKRPMGWFLYGDQPEAETPGEAVLEKLARIEQQLALVIARLDPGARGSREAQGQ